MPSDKDKNKGRTKNDSNDARGKSSGGKGASRKKGAKAGGSNGPRGGSAGPKRRKASKRSGADRPPRRPKTQNRNVPSAAINAGDRVAIVAGLRTPFVKAGTELKRMRTIDLAVECVKELVQRTELSPEEITLCVYGQVVPSVDWLNIARDVAIGAGLSKRTDAYSVSRACATSIQAMTDAAQAIMLGHHDVAIVGGADSTTDVPLKVSPHLRDGLMALQKAKNMAARVAAIRMISAKDLLPGVPGFSKEPSTGEQMGDAAEKMAKLNAISREEQDAIAFRSHDTAARAWKNGIYDQEVMTLFPKPYDQPVSRDNIVRDDTSIEKLAKLRPVFDRKHGTITAGNASPLTDGASALLLMRESKAKALGYRPIGYLKSWAYAAVDPAWQLLMAPAFAAPLALERAHATLQDMTLVDIHEAFAAQLASNLQAMASDKFAREHLNRSSAIGEVDPSILNVNGGSIAIGHPFAATGGRMVLSTCNELNRRGGGQALLTLCAAGGLGAAVVLESA